MSLSEYEQQRLENITRNREKLNSLLSAISENPVTSPPNKRRKRHTRSAVRSNTSARQDKARKANQLAPRRSKRTTIATTRQESHNRSEAKATASSLRHPLTLLVGTENIIDDEAVNEPRIAKIDKMERQINSISHTMSTLVSRLNQLEAAMNNSKQDVSNLSKKVKYNNSLASQSKDVKRRTKRSEQSSFLHQIEGFTDMLCSWILEYPLCRKRIGEAEAKEFSHEELALLKKPQDTIDNIVSSLAQMLADARAAEEDPKCPTASEEEVKEVQDNLQEYRNGINHAFNLKKSR